VSRTSGRWPRPAARRGTGRRGGGRPADGRAGCHYPDGVGGLIDSGWAAWLPSELVAAMDARAGTAAARRAFAKRLANGPDDADRDRWSRFALVAPSRIDVPASADGVTPEDCWALLAELGLAAREPQPAV